MPRLTDSQRIQVMLDLREEIRADEAALNKKKKKFKEHEDKCIALLLRKDLQKMTNKEKTGTIAVNEEDVPQIDDWDKVYAYVKKNNAFHLMYRRINPASWREEVKSRKNKAIPGVSPFTRYKLSLTAGSN